MPASRITALVLFSLMLIPQASGTENIIRLYQHSPKNDGFIWEHRRIGRTIPEHFSVYTVPEVDAKLQEIRSVADQRYSASLNEERQLRRIIETVLKTLPQEVFTPTVRADLVNDISESLKEHMKEMVSSMKAELKRELSAELIEMQGAGRVEGRP